MNKLNITRSINVLDRLEIGSQLNKMEINSLSLGDLKIPTVRTIGQK
jgi:hypothetical protein